MTACRTGTAACHPLATPPRRIGVAVLVAFLYALCYVAIQSGLALAPPLRFAGLRAAVGGIVVLAFAGASRRALVPPRRLWGGTVLLALVGTTFGFGAMFLSAGRSSAGIASVLGNTTPLLVILLAAWLLHERVTRWKALALILGFAGVVLIALGGTRPGLGGTAALIPLLAASGSAGENLLVKRLDIRNCVLSVLAWQLLVGCVPLFLLSLWLERGARIAWGPRFAGLLATLAVLGTALPSSLWYRLVQHDEVGRVTIFLFLVPVFGLALAASILRERLGGMEIAGVLLTLGGIASAMRDAVRRAPEERLRR